MLPTLGCLAVLTLLGAILTRLTQLSARIVVPVVASLITGFGAKTAAFVLPGIQNVARDGCRRE